jgi:acetyl-CoA acetyltransferase
MSYHAAHRTNAAITGVGYSPMVRESDRSVLSQAAEAGLKAIRDAGLSPKDIDGIIEFQYYDSATAAEMAATLGLNNADWLVDLQGGGELACVLAGHAALAVDAGLAKHVLCYRALNGRSGKRLGNYTGVASTALSQFYVPFGLEATPAVFAMLAQRHAHQYGTTSEHLASVAMAQRAWATRNPRALRRAPLDLPEYLASPWVAEPFRRLDCCQETDGACAFIVSRSDLAKQLQHVPVAIRGYAFAGGPGATTHFERWSNFSESSAPSVATGLWQATGMQPSDIDFAEIYDSFTWAVLATLEGFGFCEPGSAGAFSLEGNTRQGGSLPVNTHGGLLSEGYVQGVNLITEAVLQMRGACVDRQVERRATALVTATGAVTRGSAVILELAA